MTAYPVLNKAMVIDPSGELRDFLRFCAGRFWPDLEIVSYLWARGCPDATYDWTGIDLIVLEHRLHSQYDQGIDWLRTLRRIPAAPPIVLISAELTDGLRTEAERIGAAAVLDKNDLSPRRFAASVEGVLGRASVNTPAKTEAPAIMEIPGFRIIRPLDSTPSTRLSLAMDESTQRMVVLKVMRTSPDTDPSTVRRFRHECSLLAALEDPHVSRIFKWGFGEGRGFVASEYCPGGNLLDRIRLRVSMQDAVNYLTQLLRGLKAVHARGILHKAIKPTNLLLRENGTLALTGFGVERDLVDNPRLTSTQNLLGDLHYVSPESLSNGLVDLRTDLYSAGIVFYHMLTGTEPFKNLAITQMIEAHLHGPIPRLPRPLGALQPLLDGLLAKRPGDRFQSASDALDGIQWLTTACA